eukprot:4182853-Amphidinium_carterae.1
MHEPNGGSGKGGSGQPRKGGAGKPDKGRLKGGAGKPGSAGGSRQGGGKVVIVSRRSPAFPRQRMLRIRQGL